MDVDDADGRALGVRERVGDRGLSAQREAAAVRHGRPDFFLAHVDVEGFLADAALTPILQQHLLAIRQAVPPPPPVPAKVAYTFAGPDLADPQVREGYDRAAALPPGDPSMTPPRVGTVENPQVVMSQPSKGGAMERSNTESTSMTEPAGFKETAQNH